MATSKNTMKRMSEMGSEISSKFEKQIDDIEEFSKRKIRIFGTGSIRKCSMCGKLHCSGVIPVPNVVGHWNPEDEICNECLEKLDVVK
jgi:hypothetical protein